MKLTPDDHPLNALRQEWIASGIGFLVLMVVAIVVTLRSDPDSDTGLLIGVAAVGILLFKLGDLVLVMIGELRRRD